MEHLTPEGVLKRYRTAKSRRSVWEAHWQECCDFALPQRDGFNRAATACEKKSDRISNGTAADVVDQLAASLLAQLTPPSSCGKGRHERPLPSGPCPVPHRRRPVAGPAVGTGRN